MFYLRGNIKTLSLRICREFGILISDLGSFENDGDRLTHILNVVRANLDEARKELEKKNKTRIE